MWLRIFPLEGLGDASPVTTSMHRCLLITEILRPIFEFTLPCDELPSEDEEERKVDKWTLASLARTCKAFSSLALDHLWKRLDSLDPLIKLLPRRMWEKPLIIIPVRMLMGKKHWLRFRQYATRVWYLCGPCNSIPPAVQRNAITALARFSRHSPPLLPAATEIRWNEPVPSADSVSLIKFFAGSRVTTLSLSLPCWPKRSSSRRALSNLPNLFPNVTSFSITRHQSSYHRFGKYARHVGDIVRKWPDLQVLHTAPPLRPVMADLASKKSLETLGVGFDWDSVVPIQDVPHWVHTLSLDASTPGCCTESLRALQASPTHLCIQVGLYSSEQTEIEGLLRILPERFDVMRLQSLTIKLIIPSFPFTVFSLFDKDHVASLGAFSALRTVDLSSFCTSTLDDAAYARMAANWPELQSLKVGTTNIEKRKPVASIGAVIAVLRRCPHLETLHVVFDGSIPPPRAAKAGKSKGRVEEVGEGKDARAIMEQADGWGISNQRITKLHVGHSPIWEDAEGLRKMASCLRSVMPHLGIIQSEKGLTETERWKMVQHLLVDSDALDSTGQHLA